MATLQEIPLTTITGDSTSLADYAGQVLLVVNVASKCGLTPQYAGLEALHSSRADTGFQVLGFPANNFAEQEPGSDEEIAAFCKATYAIDFPMFSKISVAGDDQHPLYAELTAAAPNAAGEPDVQWNFEKFLIARDGSVAGRFAPMVTPDDPALVAAIDAELAKPAG
jgi:glutathione peroxidase